MPWYYLSFCDPGKPEGEQFLGATVIEADNHFLAVPVAHRLGVNPGGEVKFIEIPISSSSELPLEAQKYVNKFVPSEIVMSEGASPMSDLE